MCIKVLLTLGCHCLLAILLLLGNSEGQDLYLFISVSRALTMDHSAWPMIDDQLKNIFKKCREELKKLDNKQQDNINK